MAGPSTAAAAPARKGCRPSCCALPAPQTHTTLTVGGGSSAAKQVVELGIRFQGDAGLVGPVNNRLQATWLFGSVCWPRRSKREHGSTNAGLRLWRQLHPNSKRLSLWPHLLKLAVGPAPSGQLCLGTPQAQAIHAAAKGSPARKLPGACLQALVKDA